ncbi:hypothetical protein [Photorhabdus sp. SF281]|uniref:hypothetical protein n=1 Tax=Photorhabdus sp. SF281 TaxID=3459527 RepID=UPI004043EEFF
MPSLCPQPDGDGDPDSLSNPWKRLVLDKEGRITKRGYTLCFLDKLQDSLRRRDIFVANSDRWGDPKAKLLHGQEWQINRIQVSRSLEHQPEHVRQVQQRAEQEKKPQQRQHHSPRRGFSR